jgi:hypothetical protein
MASEAEIVKACLGAGTKVGAAAAVTADARTRSASIGEVVMALDAVHLAMFVVRKAQNQRLTAPYERLTEGESRSTACQGKQRDQRTEDDRQHEPRMPPEYQPAEEMRRLPSRLARGARTQQREQHDARQQYVGHGVCPTAHVPTGTQYVHRQNNHQQTGRSDMGRLKVPVARPDPPADGRAGRHRKKEECKERQYPGVLVPGSGQLDMLDHAGIDAEQ